MNRSLTALAVPVLLALPFLLALPTATGAQTYQAAPTDDIWVYPFAGDQTTDGFLRAWGNSVSSVAPSYPADSAWSHSYLKWNLNSIPDGNYRVLDARLVVTQQVNATTQPGYTPSVGQANPLEARPVGSHFDEATWSFADPSNPTPGRTVFGIGDLSSYVPRATPGVTGFDIPINLLANSDDFNAYFNAAVNGDEALALALTSALNPSGPGGATYRLYSKNAGIFSPQLFITYQAVPESNTCTLFGSVLMAGSGCLLRRRQNRRNSR